MFLLDLYDCQVYKVIKYIDHMPIELTLYYYIMIANFLLYIMEKRANSVLI